MPRDLVGLAQVGRWGWRGGKRDLAPIRRPEQATADSLLQCSESAGLAAVHRDQVDLGLTVARRAKGDLAAIWRPLRAVIAAAAGGKLAGRACL